MERGLELRRAGRERHRRLRRREPRGPVGPGRDAGPHRRRRVERGGSVPVGDVHGHRRGAGARPSDRLRRRAGVRDPLPVDVRRARVGPDRGGGRAVRDRAVRPRGSAHPPAREAAHPRGSGHGRRVGSVRDRAGLGREGGQGGLPREARAGASGRRGPWASGSSGSGAPVRGSRPRARASCTRASGSVGSPRRAGAPLRAASSGLAWVPAGWASDGTTFEIQFGRHRATATVELRPFYDPDGERLRS